LHFFLGSDNLDHRIELKIRFYPEHLLAENPEYVFKDYLGMLNEMEKSR